MFSFRKYVSKEQQSNDAVDHTRVEYRKKNESEYPTRINCTLYCTCNIYYTYITFILFSTNQTLE